VEKSASYELNQTVTNLHDLNTELKQNITTKYVMKIEDGTS